MMPCSRNTKRNTDYLGRRHSERLINNKEDSAKCIVSDIHSQGHAYLGAGAEPRAGGEDGTGS